MTTKGDTEPDNRAKYAESNKKRMTVMPRQERPLCAECENARHYKKEWVVCKENCVQHALTDACMDPKWFKPRPDNKGELEYGTILPDGTDWRLRKFDDEYETKYRIFKNENLFAQFDNREDADTVMVAMTCDPTILKAGERERLLDEIRDRLTSLLKSVPSEARNRPSSIIRNVLLYTESLRSKP